MQYRLRISRSSVKAKLLDGLGYGVTEMEKLPSGRIFITGRTNSENDMEALRDVLDLGSAIQQWELPRLGEESEILARLLGDTVKVTVRRSDGERISFDSLAPWGFEKTIFRCLDAARNFFE